MSAHCYKNNPSICFLAFPNQKTYYFFLVEKIKLNTDYPKLFFFGQPLKYLFLKRKLIHNNIQIRCYYIIT